MPYGYADSESGAIRYPTLSSILSTTPQPGMRATALDAPGSMLFEVGGKWGGSLGSGFANLTAVQAIPAGLQALLALGVTAGDVSGNRYSLQSNGWEPTLSILAPSSFQADIAGGSTVIADGVPSPFPLRRHKPGSGGRSLRRTPGGSSPNALTTLVNQTAWTCVSCPGGRKVRRARIWFKNSDATAAAEVLAVAITTRASLSTLLTNPTAGGTGWSTVPFPGGASKLTIPPASYASPQASYKYPAEACTDWFVPATQARSDGGTDWLWDVCFYCNDKPLGAMLGANPIAIWAKTSGDRCSTNRVTNYTVYNTSSCVNVWIEVEYESTPTYPEQRHIVVNGDSVCDGTGVTLSLNKGSFIHQAIKAVNRNPFHASSGGMCCLTGWNLLDKYLPWLDAEAIVMQLYTVNEQVKPEGRAYATVINEAVARRDRLVAMGYKVLLIGPFPANSSYSAGQLAAKNYCDSLGVDYYNSFADAANADGSWKTGYYSDDFHPSDTGSDAMLAGFQAWLTPRLAAY